MSIFSLLFGQASKVVLTDNEISFCEIVEYDQELALRIKEVTKNVIDLLPEVDEYAEVQVTKEEGLCSKSDYGTAFNFVTTAKYKFREKGYLLFLFEDGDKNVFLSMIKGRSEAEIVRWRQTNAMNYDLDNNKIVDRLKGWQSICQYEVLGVGDDYIDIRFVLLPEDVDSFVSDIDNFCPDIVAQGTGEISTLKEEITNPKLLRLWWD